MSLERSQYTFHTLQAVNKKDFQKEVDRITKEVDQVNDDEAPSEPAVPTKRGRFTQSPQTPHPIDRPIRPVSGTVIEVILENFLCHEHMQVTLNKEINFIVGRNGSGKSAILAALVVALGGSANMTGRGAALKDFVKHNCASAKVTCVISNAGAVSYKKDVYGDKITVIRTINSQGASTVKLRAENGKVIGTKLEDLRGMTMSLGIQVDNPISVLDQNTARHFLNQSKPSNKFELFMRATNLETLQRLYVEIALAVDRTGQEISKKERQLVDNNAEVEEAERKYRMVMSLEEDREKGNTLKMELLWAEARDYANALERCNKDLNKALKDTENLNKMLSSAEQSEPLLQEIESTNAEMTSLEEERKSIETEIKELQEKFKMTGRDSKKLDQEKESTETKLKVDKETIAAFKAEIRSQEQKMLPEHVEQRRKQRDEIHDIQRTLQDLHTERASKEAEVRELQSKEGSMNDMVRHLKRRKTTQEEEIKKLNSTLLGLETATSNLSLFGPCMPELVRQIENNTQFRKKPVGPVGSYVKVKDPQWALAVESVIRGCLHTFVVDNIADEKLLQSLINRYITRGQKPGVRRISFPTAAYNSSKTTARTPQYCNVLDMVEISNIVAHNVLIDVCHIESTLLIPTDKECHALLSVAQNVPANCGKAFTLKGDSYNPAPRYATYGCRYRAAQFMQTSRDEVIRDTRQRIAEAGERLQTVITELSSASRDFGKFPEQIKQLRTAISSISKQCIETQSKLENLKDMEQPDTNSVSVLREELEIKKKELEERLSLLAKLPSQFKAVEERQAELKNQAGAVKVRREENLRKIVKIKKKLSTCREQMDELKSAQVGKKRKLEQLKKAEEHLSKERVELEEKSGKAKEEAEKLEAHLRSEAEEKEKEFHSMSDTKRDLKCIDRELRALNKKLASVEKTLGQSTELTAKDFHEKLASYNATRNNIKALKFNAHGLKQALQERRSLYHTQKSLMCGVVSHQFTRVLRYRNCTGNVRVNFENRVLDITCGPIDEGERAGLGTSSLSGGERSYATIAFVIALWNVTELPFYYLDEFDVFMDMLNRQTVLTLLLRFAKQKRGYQFGFLTPLDTTAIASEARVSIFKLADPRP